MKTIIGLSILVACLAAFSAGAGLFSSGGEGAFTVSTIRGEEAELYGRGLYRNDSAFKAPILRGTDAATFFAALPLLIVSIMGARRGSVRWRMLLAGVLSYFLYNSASLLFGSAYNSLMPVYIPYFSASLYSFLLVFSGIGASSLEGRILPSFPRKRVAVFLFIASASLLVWIPDIIASALGGGVPAHLGPYTTEATYGLDLGVILPSAILAGLLVLRRPAAGAALATVLLILEALIGVAVASQTVVQVLDGIILAPVQFAAFVVPFVAMSGFSVYLAASVLRAVRAEA